MTTTHYVKTKPEYFEPLLNHSKMAEIRFDDRKYAVGDKLVLCEFDHAGLTGREATRTISHILHDDFIGLPKGWVMLSFEI